MQKERICLQFDTKPSVAGDKHDGQLLAYTNLNYSDRGCG